MTDLNLYQRRNAAKKAVYEHEFSKIITQGLKYKYLPVEQVKPVVEKAWNDAGIVADLGTMDLEEVRESWKNVYRDPYGTETESTWFHLRGTLKITLVNMDDPVDRTEFYVLGEAKDNSDKSINKVYTAALKNFYKTEFNIAEGQKDDTDAIQTDAALETPAKKESRCDPFFSKKPVEKLVPKPEEKVSEFVSADKLPPIAAYAELPPESELANYINVKGAMPQFRETVKAYKVDKGAKTAYDLSYDEKVELFDIITAMEEVS